MIVCAAVQWIDPINELEMTIGCIRHEVVREIGQVIDKIDVEQGFLDHEGKFYSRAAAYTIAKFCGQLSATTLANKHGSQELFSEDLY